MRHLAPIAAAAILALAACSSEPESDFAAMPEEQSGTEAAAPPPGGETPPMASDLGSGAVMQGEWVATEMAGSAAALFGPPQSEAEFSVHCEGGVLVIARSVLVEGASAEMALMAGGETRIMEASAQQDPMPQVSASIPASDAIATKLALAYDPIAVAVNGGPTYRMPASEALRNTVRGCIE